MMNDYAILYLEINLAAILLVGIILYKSRGLTQIVAQRNFAMAIYAEIVFFLSDTFAVLMSQGLLPYRPAAMIAAKTVYFFATTLMCFFWFLYFEYMQGSLFVRNKQRIIKSAALVALVVLFLIINLFTGSLFFVDAQNVYRRGSFFLLLYILPYSYVFFTCGRALFSLILRKETGDRGLFVSLALFPVAPAGAGILQFLFPRLPLACVAISLATLVLYLNWTEQMISLDPLTKLNNRKQLVYHYEQLSHASSEMGLYLLIIDANRFKGINDVYGHIQGDAALKRIAEALRRACGGMKRRANIARYGGDEFVILAEAESRDEIAALAERVHEHLSQLNKASGAPYTLTVSIGIARAEAGLSLEKLVAAADRELYQEKEKAHRK